MKRVCLYSAVAVAAFALAGCNFGPPYCGTWTADVPLPFGNQTKKTTLTLKSDNTFTGVDETPEIDIMGQKIPPFKTNSSGTYKIDKDNFTMTVATVALDPSSNIANPTLKDAIEKGLQIMVNKAQTGTYKLSDNNNTMVLTVSGTNVTFKRK